MADVVDIEGETQNVHLLSILASCISSSPSSVHMQWWGDKVHAC